MNKQNSKEIIYKLTRNMYASVQKFFKVLFGG